VPTIIKKFSTNWRMRKNKNKLMILNMGKIKDPIEINTYRSIIPDEVKKVNNQPCNADDSQETR